MAIDGLIILDHLGYVRRARETDALTTIFYIYFFGPVAPSSSRDSGRRLRRTRSSTSTPSTTPSQSLSVQRTWIPSSSSHRSTTPVKARAHAVTSSARESGSSVPSAAMVRRSVNHLHHPPCNLLQIAVDPLFAFAFLQTFIDILMEYFGTVSLATLKENFDVVYQVKNVPRRLCRTRVC